MIESGTTRLWLSNEWAAFRGLPLLVKTAVGIAFLFLVFMAASIFSDQVAMVGNHITAWWFDRSDTIAAKEIQAAKDRELAAEGRAIKAEKDATVQRAKYDLAIRAMNLSHEKGAQLDDEISKQVEILAQEHSEPSANSVPDRVLLDALRKGQAKTDAPRAGGTK